MRPLQLTMTAFGSYAGETSVDFADVRELRKNRIPAARGAEKQKNRKR